MRENGFYWVWGQIDGWSVWQFHNGQWWAPGSEEFVDDADVQELCKVGERLLPPEAE